MPLVTEADMASAAAAMRQAQRRFEKEVTEWAAKVPPEQLGILHRKIALHALVGVVNKTPVDTGRARSNWMVDINKVPTRTRDFGGKGVKRSPQAAASESIRHGERKIAKVTATPFVATHITNNLEYIEYLEAGTSKQAPNGMVALTIQELVAAFGGPVEG